MTKRFKVHISLVYKEKIYNIFNVRVQEAQKKER